MSSVINALWAQYLKLHRFQINNFINHPHKSQLNQLIEIVQTAKDTEWGKRYKFEKVTNTKQWAECVPVQDYEVFKDDIYRMMKGERNVLWPGQVKHFAKSSGTTSDKSKFIPISEEHHKDCYVKGGSRLMYYMYENLPDPRVIEGKSIMLAGSCSDNMEEFPGSMIGDVSAVELVRMPYLAQQRLFPTVDISVMPDFEEKLNRIAHSAISEDIRMVAGTPTWAIVFFKRILEITGKKNMLEVWPRMQIFVHGAVSFVPYREPFKEFFPSDEFAYQETYNASEGYFAVQSDFKSDDMLLILDNGVYYEFIPMEEWENENPRTILLSEVELGKNYAMVITTNSGLYRYKIGDTVLFTSKEPFKIKITGRTKQFINVFGEEVMVANTDAALLETCKTFNVRVRDYTVAPIFLTASGKGGHEWIIEFENNVPATKEFSKALDDNLKKVNSDYEAKRYNDLALESLKMHVAPTDTFLNWMKSRNKLGPQQKVPRLSNQREYLNEIIRFL